MGEKNGRSICRQVEPAQCPPPTPTPPTAPPIFKAACLLTEVFFFSVREGCGTVPMTAALRKKIAQCYHHSRSPGFLLLGSYRKAIPFNQSGLCLVFARKTDFARFSYQFQLIRGGLPGKRVDENVMLNEGRIRSKIDFNHLLPGDSLIISFRKPSSSDCSHDSPISTGLDWTRDGSGDMP